MALAAPMQAWSRADGVFDGTGITGIYCGDHRVLAAAELTVLDADGQPVDLAPLGHRSAGGGVTSFSAMARVASELADPLVELVRERRATPTAVVETLSFTSALEEPRTLTVRVGFVPDASPMNLIKAGEAGAVSLQPHGLEWSWSPDSSVTVDAPGATIEGLVATWQVVVPAHGSASLEWRLTARDAASPFAPYTGAPLVVPTLTATASDGVKALVARSVADLNALRLAERTAPERGFCGAGAPWFLTLFGRDSLITARLFLPADRQLALDTLHVLAARQGQTVDADRAEAPGKILHEVRAEALDLREGTVLPAEYYGTIDATPLWIILLGQVWQSGASRAEIEPLLDALVAALGWLQNDADPDGDGFLEYFDTSGHGLANQGWKDSGDSIRFADGRIAEGPIALAEVQGYAYQAARTGAELLRAFGRTPDEVAQADAWDAYADAMATRFRAQFWVSDEHGSYPALALDAHKKPVDGVASNMGHLLVTGLLDDHEVARVVERLMSSDLFSGYGIRTMSASNGRFWPTRYHVGSVWTHDSAMIIEGLLARGYAEQARRLATGLLRAADGFGGQLPELFGGQDAATVFPPSPYPAACHPQAWAAASAITIARALGAL